MSSKDKIRNAKSFNAPVNLDSEVVNNQAQDESNAVKNKVLPEMSEEFKKRLHEHVIHCAQGLKVFEDTKPPKGVNMLGNNEILQKNHQEDKLLAIFDMDETLMHTVCYFEGSDESKHKSDQSYDKKLAVKYPSGKTKYICINIRPYVMEVLKALKEYYRIAIFTASVKAYADTILDFLDPNKEIFEARFYREHCTYIKNVHVKDLRLFKEPNTKNDENWKLDEMIISKHLINLHQ